MDRGAARRLAPPRGPRAGPQTGGGAAGAGGRRAHCGPRASAAERATLRTHLPLPSSPLSPPPPRLALRPAPALAPLGAAFARHRPKSPLEPRELSEPLEPESLGASAASRPAFETTSAAAAAQPGNARLGQVSGGRGGGQMHHSFLLS